MDRGAVVNPALDAGDAKALGTCPTPWWRALHGGLMPDYNRRATLYWWVFAIAGAGVLLHALREMAALPPSAVAQIVGGAVLAMLAGFVPVRIPRSNTSFTAGEIFIFLLLLVHGPAAAALACAGESLVGAWRTSRRWTSRLLSPASAAVAMFTTGSALFALRDWMVRAGLHNDGFLLFGAICFALAYFLVATLLVALVPYLKRRQRFPVREFFASYGWLGVAYVGHASVATLLYLSFRHSGIVVVVAAVPIIVILLSTGHFFFRREEAEDAVRTAQQQQAQQRQMMELARHAGMAEIATNVLHNVGNVLNSVNVSAELIAERMRTSELPGLSRVVGLLDEHAGDLGPYLSDDPRGRMVPVYLKQLAAALVQERDAVRTELDALRKSVDHVKQVVATQQSYAGASSLTSPVRMEELIEDALRIDASGAGDRQMSVQRDFDEVPVLLADKHRTLLILLNLIANARQAMAQLPREARRLALRLRRVDDRLRIEVADNGIGIAAENLTRIFAHGFTTRKEGHGFGLHSCALAAREMGGTLLAHSDGPGHGACFVLELPAQSLSKD